MEILPQALCHIKIRQCTNQSEQSTVSLTSIWLSQLNPSPDPNQSPLQKLSISRKLDHGQQHRGKHYLMGQQNLMQHFFKAQWNDLGSQTSLYLSKIGQIQRRDNICRDVTLASKTIEDVIFIWHAAVVCSHLVLVQRPFCSVSVSLMLCVSSSEMLTRLIQRDDALMLLACRVYNASRENCIWASKIINKH